jgi:hypothetical protein
VQNHGKHRRPYENIGTFYTSAVSKSMCALWNVVVKAAWIATAYSVRSCTSPFDSDLLSRGAKKVIL